MQEKWELINLLESTEIASFVRGALQIAFQKGAAAPPLPNLSEVPYYQSKPLVKRWFEELFSAISKEKEEPLIESAARQKPSTIQSTPAVSREADQNFNATLKSLIAENAEVSAFDILREFKKVFTPQLDQSPTSSDVPSPFLETEELQAYHKEWEKGVEALNK